MIYENVTYAPVTFILAGTYLETCKERNLWLTQGELKEKKNNMLEEIKEERKEIVNLSYL